MAGAENSQETPASTEPEERDPLAGVAVFDAPQQRVHRMTDLLAGIGTIVGIVLTLLLGAYGSSTTAGFAEDVQGIASLLQRLLVAPVNIFSGIVTLVVPTAVIIDLAVRREPRRILEVLGAGILAFIATVVAAYTTITWGSEELVASLSIKGAEGEMVVQLPAYLAAVAAMLTAAGLRTTKRVLAWSWPLVWISAAVGIISGIVTLPAALTVVLIGRASGLVLRYLIGSSADRAYGGALADGIRRAGFEPRRIVRADSRDEYEPEGADAVAAALGRTRSGRVYAVTTREGHQLVVLALDGDQHAAGFLTKLWQTIRFRGLDARAEVSLRQTAESTALVSHAARTAGVRTARVLGMSQARDTMLIVYQRPAAVRPLSEVPPEDVDDAMLDATWEQLAQAHAAGISHRKLSSDTILLSKSDGYGAPIMWITSWDMGEVASSSLARRIDTVQLLASLATIVGAERAAQSAYRALGADEIEQVAPLLQSIVLPRDTRSALKANKDLMPQLREQLVALVPAAEVNPQDIARFGWRTIFTFVAAIIAVTFLITRFNTQQLIDALQQANWWWVGAAAIWGMLTFAGAGIALMAFSPVRLPAWRAIVAQVAAAYIALAVPAGIGPAALNLRLLTKRRVPTPLAVATVALVQVSAVIVTVVGLFALTLFTGSEGTLASLPSTSVLVGVGVVMAVVVAFMLVPKVRRWVVGKVMPPVRQTWPRLVQILGQPMRLLAGLGGNLLQTGAYVGAFYCTLEAFGQDLAVMDVAVVYFLSNAVGAVVPTPGGLGAVEAALIAGLGSAGVPLGVATPVVLIYRFITYWARIPLGYAAMTWLQRKGEL
ncbi:lysylphosphatidylglycerol synthase transmembrane domain-containing protein [Demequina globuliformis]|uniref:lysylphosphatidylglycerol synthase transmembrane domain-containing protein n=1 Tax=Demequina globuliformis TaxID=676202 RepID=UPI00078316AF|nr:lysylphosphatidylglycerol synthase transmembrane domain-containing protein [Demequina globuliformis]